VNAVDTLQIAIDHGEDRIRRDMLRDFRNDDLTDETANDGNDWRLPDRSPSDVG
jgi:hypothetical protein